MMAIALSPTVTGILRMIKIEDVLTIGKYLLGGLGVILGFFVVMKVLVLVEDDFGSVWTLVFFFIIFLILNLMLKKPYEKLYGDFICKPEFYNYLQQIEETAKARNYQNLDAHWDALRNRRDYIMIVLLFIFLFLYFSLIFEIIKDSVTDKSLYIFSEFNIKEIAPLCSIIAALVLFWRKAHYDGLTQGYLSGYADAFKKADDWRIREAELDEHK
jgi:hypothetical protein